MEESEAYNHPDLFSGESDVQPTSPRSHGSKLHSYLIAIPSIAESVAWIAISLVGIFEGRRGWYESRSVLMAVPWLYSTIRSVTRPTATPPFDIFWLMLFQLFSSVLSFGGILYDHTVDGAPLPESVALAGHIINLLTIIFVFITITTMPIGIPSKAVEKEKIGFEVSPEDYTVLWKWITFEWVYPLVKRGTNATLNEGDVWALSPTNQSRPVFHKYSSVKRPSLLRKLWATNSLDLSLDFILTVVSVAFNYAGPFFLKKILDALDPAPTPTNPNPEPSQRALSQAYIFAILTFLASVCKAQADVQHLWFGRRACTRLRSELMAAIYEKSLKRKDFSGIVDPKDKDNDKDKDKGKGKSKKDDKSTSKEGENKSGADVGKIVQLMSGDANRVAMLIGGIYFIYGAPFEIIFASMLLYRNLGISAFAGVSVLIISGPLNHYLASRSFRIQKGVLAARDKRMGVLNEILTGMKFIKFFAWEDKWAGRAEDARKNELKWLIKARLNNIMFGMTWTIVPILVSIVSFCSYVMLGNQLTISVAFTSIALFQMLRAPLNVIPAWVVQILQTKVSLDRIETFLFEPEVSEQISALKDESSIQPPVLDDYEIAPLGFKSASFRWNTVDKPKTDKAESSKKRSLVSRLFRLKASKGASETSSAKGPDEEGIRFELRDIDVIFPEGKLTLVTGPTASGKTALLMALLGEMTIVPGSDGEIILTKRPLKKSKHGYGQFVSYSAQSPWLQHSSIKDNIIFGQPYDPKRYDEVLECCALKPDLAIFEDGDKTEIGARGVSLSGGQKARVALARAAYSMSQYVLLDDPLSAVDSHTARHLFDKLLKGPLLANRTVVLVTHHVELVLPGADYIVRMLDGRIDEQGFVDELRQSGKLEAITQDAALKVYQEEAREELQKPTADETAAEVESAPTQGSKKPRKLIEDEQREEGAVKIKVYLTYLKATSYTAWAILITLVLLQQGSGAAEKLWIKVWGEAYKERESFLPSVGFFLSKSGSQIQDAFQQSFFSDIPVSSTAPIYHDGIQHIMRTPWTMPSPHDKPIYYVGVYSLIGLSTALIGVISSGVQMTGALRASRKLFSQLLRSVVYATIRFHDTTPAGRLLNRFSKDIETIDTSLAFSLQQVNQSIATFFSSLIIVSVIFPWFLAPASVLGYIYVKLGIGYLNTGRDLRRMESNSRSPIFSGFAELLDGIVTVRAFSAERRFLDSLFGKIDLTVQMWYTFWMTNRWLLLHYDFLGALAVLVTTILALSGRVPAGFAGLTITSAMAFTTSIYWTCRFWTQLELDLNSVERVVEYLELPQQPASIIESNRPPAYWPSSADDRDMLVVENLVVKYAPDLPSVLHNISITLKGQERVGLLGRTGSGKSTLAMSILRFVDPAEGRILIDGIDITKIGLYDLRSRMTFIPQDATLFSGTIRDNLDPFSEYTDAECLDVLYRCQMLSQSNYNSQKSSRAPSLHEVDMEAEGDSPSHSAASSTAVPSHDEAEEEKVTVNLETTVSAGGLNFSQGQRQLIALARALLRQSSLIIMDEATSSIDFKTDAKIQATIREEFKNSLLLTVAHRLKTVIDYDRLVVLDQGRVAEFDTPYNLIQKEDGIFRNMCLHSGTFKELEEAAKAKASLD